MSPESPNPRRRRRIAGERQVRGAATDERTRPEREHRTPPGWLLAVLATVTLGLVLVATVGVAAGTGIRGYQALQEEQAVEHARRTAPAAAERAAAAVLAYDHRTLMADRNAAAEFMTEGYRAKYRKTFKRLVVDSARKLDAVVTADVKASGVVHADSERVDVLLFVNQRTTSKANDGEPQLALNRVVFAMTEQQDGSWLVDDIRSY
jgi:Mce-associated membrane protein